MGRVDEERRQKILLEARRDRLAWVNEAATCQVGKRTIGRSQELTELFDRNSIVMRLFPSAKDFVDLLTEIEREASMHSSTPTDTTDENIEANALEIGSVKSDLAYQTFLGRLKSRASADLVMSMKQMLKSFSAQGKDSTLTATEFLARAAQLHKRVEAQLKEHEAWKNEDGDRWLSTRKSLERFLFHKLYDVAWSLVEDANADKRLTSRLKQLRFLTFEHLDLPAPSVSQSDSEVDGHESPADSEASSLWQKAEHALLQVSEMTWPEGKVARLLQCSELVIEYLKANRPPRPPLELTRSNSSESNGPVLPGADEFLPALILLVKTTQPHQLPSDLAYIQAYSDPQSLISRGGYVVTHFASAAHFLETLDASSLSISPEEFDQEIRRCHLLAEQEMEAQMPAALHLCDTFTSTGQQLSGSMAKTVEEVYGPSGDETVLKKSTDSFLQEIPIGQIRRLRRQNACNHLKRYQTKLISV